MGLLVVVGVKVRPRRWYTLLWVLYFQLGSVFGEAFGVNVLEMKLVCLVWYSSFVFGDLCGLLNVKGCCEVL